MRVELPSRRSPTPGRDSRCAHACGSARLSRACEPAEHVQHGRSRSVQPRSATSSRRVRFRQTSKLGLSRGSARRRRGGALHRACFRMDRITRTNPFPIPAHTRFAPNKPRSAVRRPASRRGAARRGRRRQRGARRSRPPQDARTDAGRQRPMTTVRRSDPTRPETAVRPVRRRRRSDAAPADSWDLALVLVAGTAGS
jgi:hypothetical protein